jgi:hypothetical protein
VLDIPEKEQGKERGMSPFRKEGRPRRLLVVVAGTLFAFQAIALVGAQTASAAAFTGLVSPKIFGGLADLNGSGAVTSADSWVAFYGDTSIIAGGLDCNAWATENDGTAGDGIITTTDDCTLIGFDGTANGVIIDVVNGKFAFADGSPIPDGYVLPTTFNAADPDNQSVVASDFGWQVLDGRVDANGSGDITSEDCSVDIVNGWDILGDACGFGLTIPSAFNGLIDVNGDHTITVTDDSASGFFGHAVVDGFVQAIAVGPVPTITSFSPTSGPVGTTVTINGTNFTGATSVTFNGVSASFIINSNIKITATVPTAATTGKIAVTTPGGTATSATNFTVTTVPAPTITSFTPTRGPVGTVVTIRGTNFRGTGFTTTSVTFNNVAATTFTVNSPTRITATVPAGATTGPIKVTTPGGTATSTTNFTVGPVLTHSRSLTLKLRRHLVARGVVSVGDGFSDCAASVPVKIQRRRAGAWRTVGTATTNDTGAYKKRIKDRPGRYRALAPKVSLNDGADICLRAVSPVRRHRH